MGLLSSAEEREIRDAVKLVTDTFMDTPVIYRLSKEGDDKWEEDKPNESFDNYNLLALAEYSKADINEAIDGSIDYNDVMLTLNLEDLETLGLINVDFSHKFRQEFDYFTMKSRHYRVTDIYYDGPLSRKDVLLIIKGKYADTNKVFS